MKSRLAQQAERELIEATQRLTAEQRLEAHLLHCQLVIELHRAGRKDATPPRQVRR